jgi:K+-transporting ATPase ATPase C chain
MSALKTIFQSVRVVAVLTILTGGLYPLAVTLCAKALFPKQANGSLIADGQSVWGSALLAQKFAGAKYFWPRPSGGDYATVASGATNKGPTSAKLAKAIAERRKSLGANAPVDLLTASGSGLDPHISPEAARFQIGRIAAARNLPAEKIGAIVDAMVEPPQFGIFGEPRVNVLALNRALDQLH